MTRRKQLKAFGHFKTVPPHLPSSQEVVQAHQILEVFSLEISELESRVFRARSSKQSSELQKTLADIRRKEANIRAFLAPLRRLPEELLSHIFIFVKDIIGTAWPLTQVCHHWRAVAFNTPRLWNKIGYNPMANLEKNRMSSGVQRCRTFIELEDAVKLSKGTPLALGLWLSYADRMPQAGLDLNILPTVLDTVAGRLRQLFVEVPDDDGLVPHRRCVKLLAKPLSSLESLVIRGNSNLIFCKNLLELVDTTALKLQELRLDIISSNLPTLFSMWSRLKMLEIEGSISLSILSQCANLRHLMLSSQAETTPQNLAFELATLPNLKSLSAPGPFPFFSQISTPALELLVLFEDFQSPMLLPPIPLPSLQHLAFVGGATIYADFCISPSLLSFSVEGQHDNPFTILAARDKSPKKTSSILEVFDIDYVNVEADVLLSILELHPNIKILQLTGVPCTPALIEKLSLMEQRVPSKEPEGLLCPLLERFAINFSSRAVSQSRIEQMLRALVKSRKASEYPLKELKFYKYIRGNATLFQVLEDVPDSEEGEYSDSEDITSPDCEVHLSSSVHEAIEWASSAHIPA